jgi:hypothetical protein
LVKEGTEGTEVHKRRNGDNGGRTERVSGFRWTKPLAPGVVARDVPLPGCGVSRRRQRPKSGSRFAEAFEFYTRILDFEYVEGDDPTTTNPAFSASPEKARSSSSVILLAGIGL